MSGRRGAATVLVMLMAVALACAPEHTPLAPPSPPPPPPPPPVVTGLMDIVLSNLPAPYYHFEYDSTGRVSFVSFASEFTRYDVSYAGGRINEMRNNILVNHDRLVYVYDDSGRVALVREMDSGGVDFTVVVFTYDGRKLIGIERDRRITGGFIIDKTVSLSYYPDGNLRERAEHRPAIVGFQDEQRSVDLYEQYDTVTNVDGFDLLHDDFFDHLVLLPDVQLQKGNPHRETRTGDGINYVVDYTYTYDGSNRPRTKIGIGTFTNGTNAGQHFPTTAVFTYY